MVTKIIKCSCKHPFQDSLYGAGNRVANEMRTGQLKCTVCGVISGSKGITQSEAVSAKVAAKESAKTSSAKKEPEKKDDRKKKSLKGTKR